MAYFIKALKITEEDLEQVLSNRWDKWMDVNYYGS